MGFIRKYSVCFFVGYLLPEQDWKPTLLYIVIFIFLLALRDWQTESEANNG